MIIAVSVSSGFRHEIRNGISSIAGDVQLMRPDMNYMEEGTPVGTSPSYLSLIEELPCTECVSPAVYRAGIVKKGEDIYGVVVKGRQGRISDSLALSVSVPE
jgi:ABC-type lipoprotein release transport system permease subunit